jgi:hypothetical protein
MNSRKMKNPINQRIYRVLILDDSKVAEREGFEPPVRCRTIVFKTTAFDHSAISPKYFERETRLKLATLSLEG